MVQRNARVSKRDFYFYQLILISVTAFVFGCGKISKLETLDMSNGIQSANSASGIGTGSTDTSSNQGANSQLMTKNYDVFSDVAIPTSKLVDNYYGGMSELSKSRVPNSSTTSTDTCNSDLNGHNTFAERIAYVVGQKMNPSLPRIGYVASAFGIATSDDSTYKKVSLISHPLCNVSAATLNTAYEGKNVPTNVEINKINTFVNTMNAYRSKALAGDQLSLLKAHKLWSKLYMCLAYTESLTTADKASSTTVAANYGVSRSQGVLFEMQALLNVGLYQFDPDSGGDTQSCIREWNDQPEHRNTSCKISRNVASSDFVKILGSSYQSFNAYCGVAKMISQFGVQVNTTKAFNVFPTNVKTDGSLVPSDQRCVAFTMNVNKSYNHFAAFQNGYGNTLSEIMNCTLTGDF